MKGRDTAALIELGFTKEEVEGLEDADVESVAVLLRNGYTKEEIAEMEWEE